MHETSRKRRNACDRLVEGDHVAVPRPGALERDAKGPGAVKGDARRALRLERDARRPERRRVRYADPAKAFNVFRIPPNIAK